MKVLFVDDEPGILDQAEIFLKKENENLSIETVTSVKDGLELLEEGEYGAVVSDYKMPESDGLEFLEILREKRNSKIPFIMFTGRGREEVAMKALNLGANRYLQKGGDPRSQYGVLSDAIVQEVNRREMERQLHEREERYHSIVEYANDWVWILDEEGNFVFVNETAENESGYSRDELEGKHFDPLIVPEDLPRVREVFAETLKGKSQSYEVRVYDSDGDIRTLEVATTPLKEGGEVTGTISFGRDVTERKQTEEELKESEMEKSLILQSSSEAINYTDTDFRIKWINEAGAETVGENPEDLVERHCYEIWFGRDEPCEDCPVAETMETGESQTGEKTTPDGRIWLIKSSPVEDGRGEITGAVEVSMEITGRRKTEEKLRKSEERYKTLFENTIDGIIVIDAETMSVVEANPAALRIFGYNSLEEAGEASPLDFVMPEDKDRLRKVIVEDMLEKDLQEINEFLVTTKDGQKKWLSTLGAKAEYQGGPVGLISFRDITEEKKAQKKLTERREELESILKSSDDSIYTVNKNFEYLLVNDETSSRLGREKKEIIGKRFHDLHSEEDSKEFEEKVRKVFETGKPERHEHEWGERERWFLRTLSPIKDPETDEVKSVVVVSKDITDRRTAQRREEFLHSLLRHDVKNKAQIAEGYHELLREFDLPKKAGEYLKKANKAIREGVDLIQKVQTLREIEREEEIKETDLDSTIREVISDRKSELSERGIKTDYEKCGYVVLGGSLLEELFSNLVENSIKHSGCDRIRISAEENEHECVVTVEDDGKGIPEKVKETAFKKGLGKEVDYGLGLTLVKEIAQNYKGSVEFKDSELGGARVDIHLKKA